jgi:hypothetical protein
MFSRQEQEYAPPSKIAKGAFALAAGALALSLWTSLRAPETRLPALDEHVAESSSATAEDTLFAELESIESRVMVLEQRQSEAGAPNWEPNESTPIHSPSDEQSWRYVNFVSPEPGVDIQQSEDGSLFVINSDPSLTGKVIEIEASRADGGTDKMTILVPEPDY